MERESFIFYRSFYEAIKDLPRDVQGEVYTAIMEYSLNGITTENLKPIARSIFTLIKPQLDANIQRYKNGKKGGRRKETETEEQPNRNQTETKSKPNDNVNDNYKEKVNKKKTPVFTPPTFEEVENYCKQRQNKVDANRFIDFYQSKGWMVGKNKMKDWEAAVRTWETEDKQKSKTNEETVTSIHPVLQ